MKHTIVKSIDDVAPYEGPHAIEGIRFRALRGALEVTAWGMNVIDLDPGATGYPEHDHPQDGQEEVYVILSGEVELHAGGERQVLKAGDCARVPPDVSRKLITTDSAARVLALGATPGQAFTPTL